MLIGVRYLVWESLVIDTAAEKLRIASSSPNH